MAPREAAPTGHPVTGGMARGSSDGRDRPTSDGVAAVLAALDAHRPRDEVERHCLDRARGLVRWLPRPLDQDADPTHVTGSAIVLDPGGRVLLHRHKRLGRWLQPGGHLDPGEDPAQAARREAREETGVAAEHPATGPTLIHVDIHEGPRGHVHIDLRYLLWCLTPQEPDPDPGESPEVAWLDPDRARALGDGSSVAALQAALARAADLTTPRGDPRSPR